MAYHFSAKARAAEARIALRISAAAALTFAMLAWLPLPSDAQEVALEKQEQLRALYEELLLNPADLDKSFAYVALAEEIGDYEAAIAPLERLLLTYPNASKMKLKLGEYYLKLGSNEAARAYFEEVAEDTGADLSDKEQAKEALAKLTQPEASSL